MLLHDKYIEFQCSKCCSIIFQHFSPNVCRVREVTTKLDSRTVAFDESMRKRNLRFLYDEEYDVELEPKVHEISGSVLPAYLYGTDHTTVCHYPNLGQYECATG